LSQTPSNLTAAEQRFQDYMDGIEFIDADGNVVTPEIGPDESDDPDGDRSE